MPLRKSISDKIVIAASKCLFLACKRAFDSVPLGDVTQVVSGGTPSTDNYLYWDEDIVWITPKDLGQRHDIEITNSERYISQEGLENSSAKLLPIGTVLLSSRAPIGHLGITLVPLSTNQGFKNIICSNKLDNRYLFHMLRANIEMLEELGRGNTFKEIPAKVVQEFSMPLPPIDVQKEVANFLDCVYKRQDHQQISLPNLSSPLEEQHRIVARIEELAAKIEEARGLRREAVEASDQLIISTTNSVLYSTKWGKNLIGDLLYENSQNGISSFPSSEPPGTPILRISAATSRDDAIIDESDYRYIDLDDQKNFKYKLEPDDILVCRFNGNLHNVGRFALYEKYLGITHVYPDKLIRLRVNSHKVLPQFLCLAANSSEGRKAIESFCATTAGNIGISASNLKSVPIPVPPLSEQKKIIDYLNQFQSHKFAVKRKQAEAAAELDALLPSILNKAFKGEL